MTDSNRRSGPRDRRGRRIRETRVGKIVTRDIQFTVGWAMVVGLSVAGCMIWLRNSLDANTDADRERAQAAAEIQIDAANQQAWDARNNQYTACLQRRENRADTADILRQMNEVDQTANNGERETLEFFNNQAPNGIDPSILNPLLEIIDNTQRQIDRVQAAIESGYDPARDPDCEELNPGEQPKPVDLNS